MLGDPSPAKVLTSTSQRVRLFGSHWSIVLGTSALACTTAVSATRKPRACFRADGSSAKRHPDRQRQVLSYQHPPRITRYAFLLDTTSGSRPPGRSAYQSRH